jgi:uncharacterized protein YbdZ (MbtH family)
MIVREGDREDTIVYKVLVNQEEQYSLYPAHRPEPRGWRDAGKTGRKADCLSFIKQVWTDMRPLSLRTKVESRVETLPVTKPDMVIQKSLVERLCEGQHAVEIALRPERTAAAFREALDRDYLNIKFTETKGGTELGCHVDRNAVDVTRADVENGTGIVHIEGNTTLDFVDLRCAADIDLETFTGVGWVRRSGLS